jgi:hypothetical protein
VTHVQILMCTRDGAAHLEAQLASLVAQTHADWSLAVSDDGSTDATRDILARFGRAHPRARMRLIEGPRRGSAVNFLSLLADPGVRPGPIAFADQDDVWLPHRLARGLARLGAGPGPTVYASRTLQVDAELRPLGPSPARGRLSFGNALVQNALAGNTLMLDPEAARRLRASVPAALAGRGVAHHDWWVYLLATGAGMRVVVDPEPGLLYRQHRGNLMGAHAGVAAARRRLAALFDGTWRDWTDRNLAALAALGAMPGAGGLRPEASALAAAFAAARRRGPLGRLVGLARLPVRRQRPAETALMALMALLGRL